MRLFVRLPAVCNWSWAYARLAEPVGASFLTLGSGVSKSEGEGKEWVRGLQGGF